MNEQKPPQISKIKYLTSCFGWYLLLGLVAYFATLLLNDFPTIQDLPTFFLGMTLMLILSVFIGIFIGPFMMPVIMFDAENIDQFSYAATSITALIIGILCLYFGIKHRDTMKYAKVFGTLGLLGCGFSGFMMLGLMD